MHAAAATAAAAAAAAARRNKILQCRHHHLVPRLPPRHGLATALGSALTSTSTKRARVREQLRHGQRGVSALLPGDRASRTQVGGIFFQNVSTGGSMVCIRGVRAPQ